MMSDTASRSAGRFRTAGLFMLAWIVWLLLLIAFEYVLKDLKLGIAASYGISAALELLLLLPAIAWARWRRISVSSLFGRAGAAQVVTGAFAGLLLVPVTAPLNMLWELLIRLTGGNLASTGAVTLPQTALQTLVAAFALSVCAPLVEESVMRGLVLNGAQHSLGRRRAVVLVAALFALMHGRFTGLPTLFLAGLLLTALAWQSGSLWPSVAAHASYNGFVLVMGMLADSMAKGRARISLSEVPVSQLVSTTVLLLLYALPFVAGLLAVLWAFRRFTPHADRPEKRPGRVPLREFWPWLICFALLLGYVAIDVMRIYGIIGKTR